MKQAIAGATIFTGDVFIERHAVVIEQGIIIDIVPEANLDPLLAT
ncbi:MAG: hypothetical protein ACM31G_05905, partial [Flavobacteriales bacterium]